jgi:signal transduction histidine kinase
MTNLASVINRAILYAALLTICFILDAAIRQISETDAARHEAVALERLNQLKTDLMATISHETQTPLAVMVGYAEITAKDARKSGIGGEFVENLDAIADEAKRMADMMEEMRQLALAREYAKDMRSVDITEIIHKISGLYAKVMERKGTGLALDVPDSLPLVYGSANELTRYIQPFAQRGQAH